MAKEKDTPSTSEDLGCGDHKNLSGKICAHNNAKLNKPSKKAFVKKFKKSFDYRDLNVAIDAKDQQAAELALTPGLLDYLKSNLAEYESAAGDVISNVQFSKGTLTLSCKAPGLYSGYFSDIDGQVIDKYDGKTIELIAKQMMIKDLSELPYHEENEQDEVEDQEIAKEEAIKVVKEFASEKYNESKASYIKIKMGDIEIELRKSISDFVKTFKKSKTNNSRDVLSKAISSWKKILNKRSLSVDELQAAELLIKNWDYYKEEFMQTVYAAEQMTKVINKVKNDSK